MFFWPTYDTLARLNHTDAVGNVYACVGVCRMASSDIIGPSSDKEYVDSCPDSGATSNMFNDQRFFCEGDYKSADGMFVYMGDGKPVPVAGFGTALIMFKNGHVQAFSNVLHVPGLNINLLSVTLN